MFSLFFSFPSPFSQRFPVMKERPPEKRLMVRRQWLVQPWHRASFVSKVRAVISSMPSVVVVGFSS